jgi:glycosyltransferase involved in cell wall biosynthesis
MDEVWAINNDMRTACINSGVKRPVGVVPHAVDTTKFERSYKPLDIPDVRGSFVFYFVGECIIRKNLIALLKAFHTEFAPWEPVSLVIKTGLPGVSPQEVGQLISEMCRNVKYNLKLYPPEKYHREVIITERLAEEDLMRLHVACDCFVNASHGEAACLSLYDALGVGNPVITTAYGGPGEIVTRASGWLVPYRMEPCFAAVQGALPELYSARENWASPNPIKLQEAMREAFENRELFLSKCEHAITVPYTYSYKAVGEHIKELLTSNV